MIKSLCASDIVDSKVQVEGWIEKQKKKKEKKYLTW
jgi:hypothetical protein